MEPLNKREFKNYLLVAASSNMEWALGAAKTLPTTGLTVCGRVWSRAGCDLKTGRLKGQEPSGQCARRFSGHGHGSRGRGGSGAARVERQPAVDQRAAAHGHPPQPPGLLGVRARRARRRGRWGVRWCATGQSTRRRVVHARWCATGRGARRRIVLLDVGTARPVGLGRRGVRWCATLPGGGSCSSSSALRGPLGLADGAYGGVTTAHLPDVFLLFMIRCMLSITRKLWWPHSI
jgi:hypothetical protein